MRWGDVQMAGQVGWDSGAEEEVGGIGFGPIAAKIDIAGGAVLIEAEVEFEAGFALQAEIEAVDEAAGAPIEGEGAADQAGAVVGVEADAPEVDDLRARRGADGALETVRDTPRSGAEMPAAVGVAPNPEGAVVAGRKLRGTAGDDGDGQARGRRRTGRERRGRLGAGREKRGSDEDENGNESNHDAGKRAANGGRKTGRARSWERRTSKDESGRRVGDGKARKTGAGRDGEGGGKGAENRKAGNRQCGKGEGEKGGESGKAESRRAA